MQTKASEGQLGQRSNSKKLFFVKFQESNSIRKRVIMYETLMNNRLQTKWNINLFHMVHICTMIAFKNHLEKEFRKGQTVE